MQRDAFLQRVRDAARAGQAHRVHVDPVSREVGYVGAGPDPPARMAAEVDAVGGQAHLVDDFSAGRAKLAELLSEHDAKTVLCWRHEVLDRFGLDELLQQSSVEQIDHAVLSRLSETEQRSKILAVDVGISSVTRAVAETGTLVLASQPGQERVVSLLPPVYITLMTADQMVPDLFDLFEELCQAGADALPSNLALVTGPSKTGDIELQLTTGVHGPGVWHVVIVRSD